MLLSLKDGASIPCISEPMNKMEQVKMKKTSSFRYRSFMALLSPATSMMVHDLFLIDGVLLRVLLTNGLLCSVFRAT